jgi:hypothetical protein
MTVVGARVHVFALLVLVFQLLFLKCELCCRHTPLLVCWGFLGSCDEMNVAFL